MQQRQGILANIILFIQVLLIFLIIMEDRVQLPAWLEVAGRLHPVVLHLPIGLLSFFAIWWLIRYEFKKKVFKKVSLILLSLLSLTASFTALFGFFLSRQGDYGDDALLQHKISGTILSLLCYGMLLSFNRDKRTDVLFNVLCLTSIGFMFLSGHTGGILTHGENYVLGPLISKPNLVHDEGATFYQRSIFPVLEKKCTSCHNKTKAKGKLIMTSVEEFKRGGKNGKEWEEGKPEISRMIKYIHLPLSDDDHMPPDGKPQLSDQEIALLTYWIKSGPNFDFKMTDLGTNDSLRIMASRLITEANPTDMVKAYDFDPAPEELIQKLNTPFRAVFPLYQKSPALQADFFIRESYKLALLEELKQVSDQLVVLNLSKMPVDDEQLTLIGSFKNLERLNLNFSKIKGRGLSALQGLDNLTSLSLAGTEIDEQSLQLILTLPSLNELFIWNTKVSEDVIKSLASRYPKIAFASTQFKDDRILQLGKPSITIEGLVRRDELITLKHSMPGVTIRYTLDGSTPDSLTAKAYESPIQLSGTTKLKAIACRRGWFCSDVFEITCFMEGQKPSRAELLSKTDKYYSGEGSKSLTDGSKGFIEVLNAPPWLGFRDGPLVAGFDFGKRTKINSIVISYARNLGGTYFPPLSVEVWGGANEKQLKLIKSIKVEQPTSSQPAQVEALIVPVVAEESFYKLIAKPVEKLPAWHGSKGKKGWLLIDEVIFN